MCVCVIAGVERVSEAKLLAVILRITSKLIPNIKPMKFT